MCVEDVMEMDEMLYVTCVLLPFTTNQKVPGDMPFIVLLPVASTFEYLPPHDMREQTCLNVVCNESFYYYFSAKQAFCGLTLISYKCIAIYDPIYYNGLLQLISTKLGRDDK